MVKAGLGMVTHIFICRANEWLMYLSWFIGGERLTARGKRVTGGENERYVGKESRPRSRVECEAR